MSSIETKNESAFEQFVAPENAWMHDALHLFETVFGVSDVDVDTDDEDHLVVTVVAGPVAA